MDVEIGPRERLRRLDPAQVHLPRARVTRAGRGAAKPSEFGDRVRQRPGTSHSSLARHRHNALQAMAPYTCGQAVEEGSK